MKCAQRLAGAALAVFVGVAWMGCNSKQSAPDAPDAEFDAQVQIDASADDVATLGDATTPVEAASTPDGTSPVEASLPQEAGLDAVAAAEVSTPDAQAPDASAAEAGTDAAPEAAAGVCTVDGIKDGQETDVDCGGPACDAQDRVCPNLEGCLVGADCQSKVCTGDVCQVPTCTDGEQNGNETAVDCGGTLCDSLGDRCADGQRCLTGNDCTDLLCGNNFTCLFPSCTDGVKDGGETGIDCGNSSVTMCPACPAGQGCNVGSDCTSLVCQSNVCRVPSCSDGVQNGGESDVDCGEVCGLKLCPSGDTCFTNADCTSMVCLATGKCQ